MVKGLLVQNPNDRKAHCPIVFDSFMGLDGRKRRTLDFKDNILF